MTRETPEVRFYTRPGCHLCDRALETVEGARSSYPFVLTILNVEEDAQLEERYGSDIPVIEIRSANRIRTFRHRVEQEAFEQEMQRAWNR